MRELRKDNRFLAKVRLEETLANDEDRKKSLKRIEHMLETERAGMKKASK